MCGGPALGLLRDDELELLVCGQRHLDFVALQVGKFMELFISIYPSASSPSGRSQ